MSPKSIVVIEDDPVLLHDAVLLFEKVGLVVTAFVSADEALSHIFLQNGNTAAVFSDLQMPGYIDGLILAEIVERQ